MNKVDYYSRLSYKCLCKAVC